MGRGERERGKERWRQVRPRGWISLGGIAQWKSIRLQIERSPVQSRVPPLLSHRACLLLPYYHLRLPPPLTLLTLLYLPQHPAARAAQRSTAQHITRTHAAFPSGSLCPATRQQGGRLCDDAVEDCINLLSPPLQCVSTKGQKE